MKNRKKTYIKIPRKLKKVSRRPTRSKRFWFLCELSDLCRVGYKTKAVRYLNARLLSEFCDRKGISPIEAYKTFGGISADDLIAYEKVTGIDTGIKDVLH